MPKKQYQIKQWTAKLTAQEFLTYRERAFRKCNAKHNKRFISVFPDY